MGNGTRLAVAILILFLAMVAFFFAFHPHGVENVSNPDDALSWLMGEFDVATGNSSTASNSGAAGTASAAPGSSDLPKGNAGTSLNPSTNITNLPNSSALPGFPQESTDFTNLNG